MANSWMQYPVGMEFNPDTVRNEMVDFLAVAFSPVAVNKFFHTVISSWILGAVFVVGVSAWFLLRKREHEFAVASMKVAAAVGLFASLVTAMTGDKSAYQVAQCQPMKLAAMEGLYDGGTRQPLTVVGEVKIPVLLSLLATRDVDGYVPGINDLLEGGYPLPDGTVASSAADKMANGRKAIAALSDYREAKQAGDEARQAAARQVIDDNMKHFGYGYIDQPDDLVPNVWLTFWAFRVMVGLGVYFIAFFVLVLFLAWKRKLEEVNWLHYVALAGIPLAYLASQAGWIVAEVGRQPWTIQDLLPVSAAVSRLETGAVATTFFIFLVLFTVLLAAEVGIMVKAIQKGPESAD